MPYLWLTTLIWAFSFSLIGRFVAPACDSYLAVLVRCAVAFAVFAPLTNWRIPHALKLKFAALGALQIGVMSIFYYNSFKHLAVSEVALFTIFTPFWVGLIYSLFTRKFEFRLFAGIAVCIFGAGIIKFSSISSGFWLGFALIQGANFVFALGQVGYKMLCECEKTRAKNGEIFTHRGVFGYFFLGAAAVGGLGFALFGNAARVPSEPAVWGVLLYLGLIASALGYFSWNKGACAVSGGVLAVMNNAVIPCAILVELLVFGGRIASPAAFVIGSAVMFSSLLFYRK